MILEKLKSLRESLAHNLMLAQTRDQHIRFTTLLAQTDDVLSSLHDGDVNEHEDEGGGRDA